MSTYKYLSFIILGIIMFILLNSIETLNIGEECTEDDYKRAELVWNTFNCQTFEDYHDIYLKADVLLLTDVFEKFRSMNVCAK